MKSLPTHSPHNVAAIDERDPNAGGARHRYAVAGMGAENLLEVQFQHGPRGEPGSTEGVMDDDLLAMVSDRLRCFQAGPFPSPANQRALDLVEQAREALGERVAERMSRSVLGRNVE